MPWCAGMPVTPRLPAPHLHQGEGAERRGQGVQQAHRCNHGRQRDPQGPVHWAGNCSPQAAHRTPCGYDVVTSSCGGGGGCARPRANGASCYSHTGDTQEEPPVPGGACVTRRSCAVR
jgi:hypothetical protein